MGNPAPPTRVRKREVTHTGAPEDVGHLANVASSPNRDTGNSAVEPGSRAQVPRYPLSSCSPRFMSATHPALPTSYVSSRRALQGTDRAGSIGESASAPVSSLLSPPIAPPSSVPQATVPPGAHMFDPTVPVWSYTSDDDQTIHIGGLDPLCILSSTIKHRLIDLCCGVGGLSWGARQITTIIAASEVEPDFRVVYEKNFGVRPYASVCSLLDTFASQAEIITYHSPSHRSPSVLSEFPLAALLRYVRNHNAKVLVCDLDIDVSEDIEDFLFGHLRQAGFTPASRVLDEASWGTGVYRKRLWVVAFRTNIADIVGLSHLRIPAGPSFPVSISSGPTTYGSEWRSVSVTLSHLPPTTWLGYNVAA